MSELTRLNFVALATVLEDLAADDLAGYDPGAYEALERNQSDSWADIAVRGGSILQPGTAAPYRADLAFDRLRDDRLLAGCAVEGAGRSRIVEIGDARFLGAGREVDADGGLVLAPFTVGVEGWGARRWLDAEGLERLAGMGVGTVRWVVKRRRSGPAEALARGLDGPGRARLEPVAVPAVLPRLVIGGPPAEPASDALGDVLEALGGEGWRRPTLEMLQRLWLAAGAGRPGSRLPAIRRGRPASFLVVSPVGEGLDLGAARLSSVWIDGVEVER